ncbi:MAG: exopolysaccharide biosynthesis protein [Solirubrobacteraceae bacterium]
MSDALAPTVSDELEQWLGSDQPKTLGNLTELFGPRSFALVFVLLMALPALPLPTGGATHVFEVVTMLVALQLVVGRRCIWLPARWQRLQLAGPSRERLLNALLQRIRWLERFSRPRATSLFDHRATTSAFGLLVFGLTLSAFLAPPFSGLDTLPSLGVVVIGLGVLNRDIVLALAGAVIGAVGVATVLALGNLVVKAAQHVV